MKKLFSVICIILLVVVISTALIACEEKPEDKGITVSFVTGFDDIIIDPVVVKHGVDSYMPDDPVYIGYYFEGWYYDAEFTREFSVKDGFTADTTLYAKWRKRSASIEDAGDIPTKKDENGFTYGINSDDTLTVLSYTGTERIVTISATYDGFKITALGSNVFGNNDTLESLTLPKYLERIDHGAIVGCTNISNISVHSDNQNYSSKDGILYSKDGKTVALVPVKAVNGTFTLGDNVTKIDESAFAGGDYTVALNNLKVITNYAFSQFSGSVTVGEKVVEIQKYAFYNADCQVIFDDNASVKRITNGAFDGYVGEKIVFNANVDEVSDCAFNNCTAVIDISKCGLTYLGARAFFGYKGESITVPYSVSSIGESCFYKSATKVTFEENSLYTVIDENTFNQFGGEVVLPRITTVKKNAFYATPSTAKIRFCTAQGTINFEEGAFNMSKAEIIYA